MPRSTRARKTRRRLPPETFGTLLLRRLEAMGMSQRGFARAVGQRNPNINMVIKGRNAPPLKHIERWMATLKLNGQDAAEFRLAAALANSPPEVRAYVAALTR